MKKALIIFFALTLFISLKGQEKEEWKVEEARGPSKEVSFKVNEGTWMNLDVSPDGKEIIFDLLGDIYSLPIGGGKAKVIASGLPYEVHPRYSPDGKQIAFTSDRGGGDNIWIMNRDGSDKKQITKESFRLLNNAVWSPDGEYLFAKKHFTSGRSLGAGEIWMYHTSGGTGIQLTTRKNDQMDVGEPWVSPDGRYVYFSEDMSPGSTFLYNKNPHRGYYWIRRYDRVEGGIEMVAGGPGGAVRPQISPDGKLLAFVRRVQTKTVLYLHNLSTGEEWPIYDDLHKDQQETWATFGVYPNFNWMPDGNSIIINAKGKIKRVNIEDGTSETIPFTANVKQTIQDALKFPHEVSPENFDVKMIRHCATSPDEKSIVFNAIGHLWIRQLPDGKPERLTSRDELEFQPSFSADGERVVYTTWSDEAKGSVKMVFLGDKSIYTLTTERGYYHAPKFSADGRFVVYAKGGGNTVLGNSHSKNTGIYMYSFNDDKNFHLTKYGYDPMFDPQAERIYFTQGKNLKSINLNGKDERTHFSSKYATDFVPSPDMEWIAFRELFNVYITKFPKSAQTVDLSSGMQSVPVFKATRDAGRYLHWSADSKKLHWTLGPEYFTREMKDCFLFVEGAPDSLPPVDTTGLKIGLNMKTDVPHGKIVLAGARIITVNGNEVIENGSIVIEGNRIVAIGATADMRLPSDAYVMNCQGKTIMPGIVDVHAHMGQSWNGISPQQQWSYYANLAFGVTTTHDPSANTEMIFSQSEMIKAGLMTGPRVYSTGTILYGAEGDFKAPVNNLDDARAHIRRLKAVGAISVKSYNQPRREQRQQVIQAAREQEIMVYPEGGSFFYHNMSMILDGHTGVEHSIPVSPLYEDVVKLWSSSKTGYTPTLIVGYGGLWGEEYWYDKTEVWKNERLLTYTPRRILDARSIRRTKAPDNDYGHIKNAEGAYAVAKAGGRVQLGAHGQLEGLGAHWELWMLGQGGFPPMDAIRAATLWGAEYISMEKDLGSLEKGKLADLIIMDKNPLEDLRNSESISHVMMNGRLYDAATMNEIGNTEKERAPFFWENSKGNQNFEWHDETQSFDTHKCGCFHAH